MRKLGFLGFPEPDGGIPFGVLMELSQSIFVVLGVMKRGFSDLESQIVEQKSIDELKTLFQEKGLQPVEWKNMLWLLQKSVRKWGAFAEYEIIAMNEERAKEPSFRKGDYDPLEAMKVAPLMHPQVGVFFPLSDQILEEGIKGLQVAFKNKEEIQQQIIDAVVDSCADLAWEQSEASSWRLALDAASILYFQLGQASALLTAQNNRKAMKLGATGSQIPWIRSWSNQQLLNSVAIAQLLAREE